MGASSKGAGEFAGSTFLELGVQPIIMKVTKKYRCHGFDISRLQNKAEIYDETSATCCYLTKNFKIGNFSARTLFFSRVIAPVGLRSFGQTSLQLNIVWQRKTPNSEAPTARRSFVAPSRESSTHRSAF